MMVGCGRGNRTPRYSKIMEDTEVQKLLLEMKSNLLNWREWFDIEVKKEHSCTSLPEDLSSKILYCCDSDGSRYDWYFASVRLATYDNVKVGEAEKVADLMAASIVLISYCPFCGIKLN